jgi:FkbM family methyltransferase
MDEMSQGTGSETPLVSVHGRSFHHAPVAVLRQAAGEFTSGFEEGTLRFFDAVLPLCHRMVDFGAYVGFTALYAATFGLEVVAFEPSPTNFALLEANVAANPALAPLVQAFRHGLGAADQDVVLYAKGAADSGSSVFRTIERGGVLHGRVDATIPLRDAAAVLREVAVDHRSLLKIDIEGGEYAVLPAIAPLLAARKPWLHVSFHPFNLVVEGDPYLTALQRLRAGLEAAEALACYRFMHLFEDGAWCSVGPAEQMDLLRQYLLKPKPVPRIGTQQYGFVDAVAFSDIPLPAHA